MMQENGEVVVRDLGSTNGIRINGQRVEMGRLKANDELSIAHIRYRLDTGQGHDQTLADGPAPYSSPPIPSPGPRLPMIDGNDTGRGNSNPNSDDPFPLSPFPAEENALAAAVRKILPSSVAEKCRIQVIVQMAGDEAPNGEAAALLAKPRPDPENPAG